LFLKNLKAYISLFTEYLPKKVLESETKEDFTSIRQEEQTALSENNNGWLHPEQKSGYISCMNSFNKMY
jgi:hypothetical protein